MGNVVPLHLAEDMFVDEVFSLDLALWAQGKFAANALGKSACLVPDSLGRFVMGSIERGARARRFRRLLIARDCPNRPLTAALQPVVKMFLQI